MDEAGHYAPFGAPTCDPSVYRDHVLGEAVWYHRYLRSVPENRSPDGGMLWLNGAIGAWLSVTRKGNF